MKDLNLTYYRCCEGSTLLFFLLILSSRLLFLNSKSRSSDFELLLSISTNKLMKYQIRLNTVIKKISEIRVSSFKQRRILARWSASLYRSQRLNRTGSSTIALEELVSLAPTHRSELILSRGSCSQLCPIWCLLREHLCFHRGRSNFPRSHLWSWQQNLPFWSSWRLVGSMWCSRPTLSRWSRWQMWRRCPRW